MATITGLSAFMSIRGSRVDSSTLPSAPSQWQQNKAQPSSGQLLHFSKEFLEKVPPYSRSTSRRKARDFVPEKRSSNSRGIMRFRTPVFADALMLLEKAEETENSVFSSLDRGVLGNLNTKDIVMILSAQKRWCKAFFFFKWLHANSFKLNSYCYNVMLKILRNAEQWEYGKVLVDKMAHNGVPPNNVTYSTIISFAIRCGKTDDALHYFQKMQNAECCPDSVTYCSVIEALAKSSRMKEASEICSKMQEEIKPLDMVAYSQVIKLYGMQGKFIKMLEVYKEMQSQKIIPNVIVYNSMITMLSAAGRSQQVQDLFKDMLGHGLKPTPVTLSLLFRAFAKTRKYEEANELYTQIKSEEWIVDAIVYNSMLSLCAQTGRIEEGEKVMRDLMGSKACKPDDWTWKILIDMYAKGGKFEEGRRIAKEMADDGQPVSTSVYMSLIQAYAKAKDFKSVVELFDELKAGSVPIDHMLAGALLSVLVHCEEKCAEEYFEILDRIELIYKELRSFVDLLTQENSTEEEMKKDLEALLNATTSECKRPFCNMLLDLCWAKNMEKQANQLFLLSRSCGVYEDLQRRSSVEWCLKLRTLSFGAARCALDDWVISVRSSLEGGISPALLNIEVGVGGQPTPDDTLMSTFILDMLNDRNAPFKIGKPGWLTANVANVKSWLLPSEVPETELAKIGAV